MHNDQKFFICKECGNVVGLIHNGKAPLVCCGENMTELVANTTDASQEKHVPVIDIKDNIVTVKVGSALHPMTEEHHIAWVYLQTENGGQRKSLEVTSDPAVEFSLRDDKAIAVFAYCNLHGLWKADV